MLFQPLGIPGGGGGVAADIDHPAGGHGDDSGKGCFVTAFAGRVEHHNIRVQALGGKLRGRLTSIGAEETALCGYGITHAGSIGLGAFDGLRHDLHADELPAMVCHGQANGAHAAVEVQQQVIRGQLSIFCGNAIELLSGQSVDLIERQGAQLHRNAAEGVLDEPGAVQGVGLAAQNHIGVFGVDIDQDGGDIGKLRSQCAAKLLCVGQLCPGADQTDHDLAAVDTPAQKHMTHQPLARLLIVGLNVVGGKEIAEGIADLVQHIRLQLAVWAGNNAVGAPGVETDAGLAVLITAHRELNLIAVAVDLGGGEGRQHGYIQPANAAESIGNAFALGAQFSGIIQMPQAAAAAGAGHCTIYRDTIRRGSLNGIQNTESVAAAIFDDADGGNVTGGGAGYEHSLAVRAVSNAAAIVGQALNGQGQHLIFL